MEVRAAKVTGKLILNLLKKLMKEAEKLGFGIIQISIGAVYGVKDMFDTYIDIGYNLEEMPKLLNEIVKTKVIKTKHTTVS